MTHYKVYVSMATRLHATLEVNAENEDAAIDQAYDLAESVDWDINDAVFDGDDFTVDRCCEKAVT